MRKYILRIKNLSSNRMVEVQHQLKELLGEQFNHREFGTASSNNICIAEFNGNTEMVKNIFTKLNEVDNIDLYISSISEDWYEVFNNQSETPYINHTQWLKENVIKEGEYFIYEGTKYPSIEFIIPLIK